MPRASHASVSFAWDASAIHRAKLVGRSLSSRVTIRDMAEVSHTVIVSAESLYEAVALGLAAIRGKDWVETLRHEYGTVDVSVSEIPVRHTVEMKEFNARAENSRTSRN